tara:strand:+ start:378 stop:698 length:321 start_codon:yes stop_codon:yes gene_type:complete
MNFGKWIKSHLFVLRRTDTWFVKKTGMGNSGVNRWVNGQTPRVDMFVVCCEVLARTEDRPLDELIQEALMTIPAYRSAVEREALKGCSPFEPHKSTEEMSIPNGAK